MRKFNNPKAQAVSNYLDNYLVSTDDKENLLNIQKILNEDVALLDEKDDTQTSLFVYFFNIPSQVSHENHLLIVINFLALMTSIYFDPFSKPTDDRRLVRAGIYSAFLVNSALTKPKMDILTGIKIFPDLLHSEFRSKTLLVQAWLKALVLMTPLGSKPLLELAVQRKNIPLMEMLFTIAVDEAFEKSRFITFCQEATTTQGNFLHEIANSGDMNLLTAYVNQLLGRLTPTEAMDVLFLQAKGENYLGFMPYYFDSDKSHPLNQCIALFGVDEEKMSTNDKYLHYQKIISSKKEAVAPIETLIKSQSGSNVSWYLSNMLLKPKPQKTQPNHPDEKTSEPLQINTSGLNK